MNKKRKQKNTIRKVFLYFATSITVFIFLGLFFFLIRNSLGHMHLKQITSPYWPKNQTIQTPIYASHRTFEKLTGKHCSKNFGVCLKDEKDLEGKMRIVVVEVAKESPLIENLKIGESIESLEIIQGNKRNYAGRLYDDNAEALIHKLEQSDAIENLYFQSTGGGLRGSLIATIYLLALSLLLAVPFSLLVAIYLNEYARNSKFKRITEKSIEVLAGIPSLMFGLMGLAFFYPFLYFFQIEGLSIYLGSLTMALMLLPNLIRMNQEALQTVPNTYREASYALGAEKSQTITKIILPQALPSLLSAVLLGASKVLGESAALIYTMGTFINDEPKLRHSATSLTVHLWSLMQEEQVNMGLASSVSLYILIFIVILNISARVIVRRFEGGRS